MESKLLLSISEASAGPGEELAAELEAATTAHTYRRRINGVSQYLYLKVPIPFIAVLLAALLEPAFQKTR